MKHNELTEQIIKIFYKVYNTLGYGFLEKIYENAMMIEFRKAVIPAVSQSPIKVVYEGELVGEHSADILVDKKVIVESIKKRFGTLLSFEFYSFLFINRL